MTNPAISPPHALYIHLPFCLRKCAYCDFFSVAGQGEFIGPYVEALAADLRHARAEVGLTELRSVYLGGGTPTVLPPDRIAAILAAAAESFALAPEAEITCECNPGTVDLATLGQLRAAGVNRISIGVQSFRDEELRFLGRIHSAHEARRAVLEAREAGFGNLSLDLIYCLPGQTADEWQETLDRALALCPDHVSAYCLQIEPGTPLAERMAAGELTPMPDDDQATLYGQTREALEAGGLRQYEISNFARPGAECRHNLTYWRNEPYLGVGAGAWSFVGGERRQQIADVAAYLAAWREGEPAWAYQERCAGAAAANETLMMALRTREGLSLAAFAARHGIDLATARAGELERLVRLGFLSVGDGRLRPTPGGMAVVGEITTLLALAEKE